MFGVPSSFRPDGGGRGTSQTPQQQQVHPNTNPNFNLITNPFLPQQNPNFLPPLLPFFQNPLIFSQIQQQFPNNNFPVQLNTDYNNFQSQYPNVNNNSTFSPQHVNVQNAMVEKLDKAALKARKEFLRLNVNVSLWKVSQAALLAVKAESWESLGLQMQQLPSLNDLLVTEGKINAFIHCFVAVRRITSLYDLEVAICESEGVKRFEELELGPLVRHPLAVHYFSVPSNLTEVYRIRTEEIIDYLYEFTCTHKKKEIKVDTFLDFICKKQSVSFREVLCMRAENFGFYVNLIKQASQSEESILENCYKKMRMTTGKRHKKRRLFSAQKKEMDENFISISQRMKSFSSLNTQFCGKHIRFMSSSSEGDSSEASDYEDIQDQKNTNSSCSLSQPNGRTERVHSCPYPSRTEELRRLGLKREAGSSSCTPDESVRCIIDTRRKRKHENMSSGAPLPCKLPIKDKFAADLKRKGSGDEGMDDHLLPIASLKKFVTTWKHACRGNSADKIVTREAIPYGQGDGTFFSSLVNWVLPYAQRYIHNAHPDKYFQLKQSGFDNITHVKIVVVEKLFYRNKVEKWEITSKKRHQCYCLLQESILYCSRESDPHSIFLELSRLLFDGTPELHFANFLHMITLMAKLGATEGQIDLFIVNSLKVPMLPSEEPIWSLQPASLSMENNTPVLHIRHSLKIEEGNSSLDTGEPGNYSNWPPADWKTAPGLIPIRPSVFENPWPSLLQITESSNAEQADISPPDNSDEFNNEVYSTATTQGPVLVKAAIVASECNTPTNSMISSSMNIVLNSVDLTTPYMKNTGPSDSTERNQVSTQQAMLTGRLGELVAFKYFEETAGECFVKWVNEANESGLPYDIVLGGNEKNDREYVEVKATRFGRKNWFLISMREWQFAVEKGESFSIAHVVLADDNMARVTIYKNPARLCQSGDLKLAIVVAKQ